MTDLVIGAINNLRFDQIQPWLDSLVFSGYKGDIALYVYNADADTVKQLRDHNVIVCTKTAMKDDGSIQSDIQGNIMVRRFFDMWQSIKANESQKNERYENIITTDVRDVVFQSNPSRWIAFRSSSIIVAGENIRYEDEPWSRSNMSTAFGSMIYSTIHSNEIVCAGVIAGERKYVLDLFLAISLFCNGMPEYIPGGGGPDQAALNLILNSEPWKQITQVENIFDAGIVHLGTSMAAIENGKGQIGFEYVNGTLSKDQIRFVMPSQPQLIDGKWCAPGGRPYVIVHQYDRAQ